MNQSRTKYSPSYTEYQKSYHKKWLALPEKRAKWNAYQRARTVKNSMELEVSRYFKGKTHAHIEYDEALCAYRVTCLFKKLTAISGPVFEKTMAEKGFTVIFDTEVTISKILEVPSP